MMNMKKFLLVCVCFVSFVSNVFAAEATSAFPPDTSAAQQAIASPDYIVTAGDIYALAIGSNVLSVTIDASYKLRVGNLGVINVKGLTFQQLKNKVENLVNSNYPTTTFQFYITNPASFKVLIVGEVTTAGELTTWSLRRLSSIIGDHLTAYSSTRNIVVESEDGTKKTYDLFKKSRYGDMSQDPYLRPNDKIIISEYDRKVSIGGAVRRPGTYELLEGEQIQDLINVYAEGYTDYANKNELTLSRFIGGKEVWEKKNLTEADVVADIPLFDKDTISVLQYSITRNVFYVEGSVVTGEMVKNAEGLEVEKYDGTAYDPVSFNRMRIEYTVGLNYPTFIKEHKGWFTNNSADLENSYIKRIIKDENSGTEKEEIIKIDINKIFFFGHPIDYLYRDSIYKILRILNMYFKINITNLIRSN